MRGMGGACSEPEACDDEEGRRIGMHYARVTGERNYRCDAGCWVWELKSYGQASGLV